MRRVMFVCVALFAATLAGNAQGQARRPASPHGTAAVELGGSWVKGERGNSYQGGKWIEITYGQPIKRGRTLFGAGTDTKGLLAGAPIWRAGADQSTRLKTEVPLTIGGKTVPAGEYSLFIDGRENNWTLVVSSWSYQETYDPSNKAALWGAYGYTPDKDVARVPMTLAKNPLSMDQLTWGFADVTSTGGKLVLMWDTVIATAPFSLGT